LGIAGPLFGCFLIILESIIPMLPLCVFITLNCMAFGYIIGFLISWLCTCLGCLLSFSVFDKGIKNWFDKKIRVKDSVNKIMKVIEKCNASQLAMIVAVPFTPAFLVNIAAGLSKMDVKKFMTGIFIGKFFMVYFWAFIGTNLIQSLRNPIIMVRVICMVIIAYVLSKVVTKKFNL
jgi:uncharacterized membrane protein YdjX (TVP38/TMEM64 family)